MGRGEVNFAPCATIICRGSNAPDDRIRARRYLGCCSFQPGWVPDRTFPKFHLPFSKIERCLSVAGDGAYHSTQEGAMQRTFFIIAVSALGITTASGQTVPQLTGQTSSSESTVASDTLGTPTSSPPSTPLSGPVIGSVEADPLSIPTSSLASAPSPSSGSGSGPSTTTTGLAIGGPGGMNAATTTSPQLPSLLRGEIPDTSTQAANATASAPAPPSPICAPPVPSTDGGSANLSEIAGLSLNGC